MGKRLKSQRRGSGLPKYLSKKTLAKADVQYRTYDDMEKTGVLKAQVLDFIDDPVRYSILMAVKYDNNEMNLLIAPEGIAVGDYIEAGAQAKLTLGSVLPLYRIPDGTNIYNIEMHPGDGGKLIRTSGSSGTVVSREGNIVYVRLPSKKTITLSNECRAQLGIIAGGGRVDKPLMKAGNAYYKHRARPIIWPRVRGVKMSPYCHPHGGKQHHVGKPTTIARGAPPGSKVGHIAARTTGRRKTKRTGDSVQ